MTPPAISQGASSLRTPRGRRIFQESLLAWYERNARDLPWRSTRDPYRVWLSEIMLQQTRVAAVLDHYARFLKRFPTIEKLAAAREPSVLAAWSGLGYYRRACMLHAAARKIVREMSGNFPATSGGLRALPGIGRYTGAAIASIAFNEPVPVVDGNVERVLQRLMGKPLSERESWQTAGTLLSRERPGDFNQAMMELGATVCLPRQPLCLLCPVMEFCRTRGRGAEGRKRVRQHKREIHYALNCRNGSVLLVKRPGDATLMPGMWELPENTADAANAQPEMRLSHSITVTDYTVLVARGEVPEPAGQWVPRSRLRKLPLTGLARKILRAAQIM